MYQMVMPLVDRLEHYFLCVIVAIADGTRSHISSFIRCLFFVSTLLQKEMPNYIQFCYDS
jgi:hypothetical protein